MQGGLRLLAQKDRLAGAPIRVASVPSHIELTMQSTDFIVSESERVLLGQPLTSSDEPIHASVSGQVSKITANAIVIENDGRDEPHASMQPLALDKLTPDELRTHIARAGIAGLGGAAFATGAKLAAAAQRDTRLLIINGAECEPYIACDEALMRTQSDDVVSGTQALLHACGATSAVLAIEADKPAAIAAMTQAVVAAHDPRLQVRTVAHFYPAGGEHTLIRLIANKEVPSGAIPPDIGVLCHNVGTAVAVARLVRSGEPLIQRVVTVTGNGVAEPRNLHARFGTSIADLIADCGGYVDSVERLIMGGPMMGVALTDDARRVSPETNCVIAATAQDLAPRGLQMPCIRCGDCATVCPANLLPQQLFRHAQRCDRDALLELGLADCIECGCCDYVCPSQIPLVASFIRAKTS